MIPYPLLTSPGSPSGSPSASGAASPSGGGAGVTGLLIDQLTVKPTSAISTFRKLRTAYNGAFVTQAGGLISGIPDQSVNARNYAQATGANKPLTSHFGDGGVMGIRLDTNAKYLSGALLSALMTASTGTIVALAYVDLSNTTAPAGTANTGAGVIADTAEGGQLWAGYNTGALKFGAQGFDGGYKNTANLSPAHDQPAVMIWQHGSGTLTVMDAAGNTQTVAMGDITYGAFNHLIGTSDGKTMIGRVFEVLTFDQVLGAGDLATINAWMAGWINGLIVDVSGFPSAANTGFTGALTTQTGDITLSTPGQVYQNNDLTGKITVNANNITIQNCRVLANGDYVIIISDGITGTIVQDCEIYSTNVVSGITALHGDGTFRRNNIHNVENGITVSTNAVITDNYIHDLAGAVDSHFDCIECNGLQTRVVISHNTLLNPTTQTSAININDGFGASSNILVDNNYCTGGAYTIYVAGASADLTGITVSNNVIDKGAIGYLNIVNATPVEYGNRNYRTGHPVLGQANARLDYSDRAMATLNAIGDSIVFGDYASDTAHQWLDVFAFAYSATATNNGIEGTVLQNSMDGAGNARANNGRDRFYAAMTGANKKAFAVVAYGFNDARYVNAPSTFNVAAYLSDYREVLSGLRAAGYAQTDILVVAPYYITDTGLITGSAGFTGQTRAGFHAFVDAAATIAAEFGVYYFDAYAYMLANGADALLGNNALGGDIIHPNDTGHAVIAAGGLKAPRATAVAPTLAVASAAAGQLDVTVGVVAGAVSYEIAASLDRVFTFPFTYAGSSRSHSFTGLLKASYWARARAVFLDGSKGPWGFSAQQAVAAAAGVFLTDNFIDFESQVVTSHTGELGGTWTLQTGNTPANAAVLNDGYLWGASSTDVYKASGVPASADYYVEAVVTLLGTINAADNIGVTGRAASAANTYYFARFSQAAGGWQLFKNVAATVTQLGATWVEAFGTGPHTVRLTMTGTTIGLKLDGTDRITVTDAAISTAGFAGVRLATVVTRFDGLRLDSIIASA